MHQLQLSLSHPPWHLSGIVYGTLLNDRVALAALGDAVHQPPYKAPPKAPVLYIKPGNTLAATGAKVVVPHDVDAFEIGAALGLVIGRTACQVDERNAMQYLAGYILVADLSVPHESFYRPSIRFKARDGSCLVGSQMVTPDRLPAPDALSLRVLIDGELVHTACTADMVRPVARLLAEVSEFMTLHPGDVLMLGVAGGGIPRARAGQHFAIETDAIGRLDGALVAERQGAAA